jgi:hypothetical protein
MRTDQIWQNRTVAESFLTGVRGAIPFATEQIDIALRVLDQLERPLTVLPTWAVVMGRSPTPS